MRNSVPLSPPVLLQRTHVKAVLEMQQFKLIAEGHCAFWEGYKETWDS